MDREAHQQHAFVRSTEWLTPGRYIVRCRVHFTTSYVSGALVFGWTRRDRNLRLTFSAGDFLYSIGRKEDGGRTKAVQLGLTTKWERDGPLPGSRPYHKYEFDEPSSFVDLELRVDGPTVDCIADGKPVFSYTTPDLSAIEGAVGLAMGQGAVRWQTPTVQRVDRGMLTAPGAPNLAVASSLHRRLPGIPTGDLGVLAIWMAPRSEPGQLPLDLRRLLDRLAPSIRDQRALPQPWVIIAPKGVSDETRKKLDSMLREYEPNPQSAVIAASTAWTATKSWAAFVDARGLVRALRTLRTGLPGNVATWARHYRPPVQPGGFDER